MITVGLPGTLPLPTSSTLTGAIAALGCTAVAVCTAASQIARIEAARMKVAIDRKGVRIT